MISAQFVLKSVIVFLTASISAEVIHIKQGDLRGFESESRNGTKYFGFLGIPYAAAPVNELRFQAPQPHHGWPGERDATKEGNICPQPALFPGNQSEDCLNLNVYTPKLNSSAKLPVMFLIHGGGFTTGGAKFSKEKYLMDQDVVYVSINYRLGVLGFISFGDQVVPGNQGMKDQVLALRWVHDNIEQFGGDPNKVTIFGFSAGGASVDFHVISPQSKDLFRSAILQSGTASCPWAVTPQNIARQRAEAVATLLGCPSKPTSEAVACLQAVPAESFVAVNAKFEQWVGSPPVSFAPVIDNYLNKDSFLPNHPLNLSPNQVHVILGINSHDGSITVNRLCSDQFKLARELEADVSRKLPVLTNIQDSIEYKDKKKFSEDLMSYYLKGDNITEDTVGEGFSDLSTDLLFSHCAYKTALHYYKHIPVYFYLFDIEIPRSVFNDVFGTSGCAHAGGPGHGDESYYLFNDFGAELAKSELPPMPVEHEILGQSFIGLWTNFARTGVPGEKWTPVKSDKIEYLYLNKNETSMKNGFYESRMKFLDSLPWVKPDSI
uniref:Carboxylic ester hydrolase n=1 Tax=Cacopsylla melanoneura TaxID=428564 RepID=A0A8D9BJA1_9HEMI